MRRSWPASSAYAIWDEETFQSWAWDPQVYAGLAGNSLYALMSREFAPLPVRVNLCDLPHGEDSGAVPTDARQPGAGPGAGDPRHDGGQTEWRRDASGRRHGDAAGREPGRGRPGAAEGGGRMRCARRWPNSRTGWTRLWCPMRRAISASAPSCSTRSWPSRSIPSQPQGDPRSCRGGGEGNARADVCGGAPGAGRTGACAGDARWRRRRKSSRAVIEAALALAYAQKPPRDKVGRGVHRCAGTGNRLRDGKGPDRSPCPTRRSRW